MSRNLYPRVSPIAKSWISILNVNTFVAESGAEAQNVIGNVETWFAFAISTYPSNSLTELIIYVKLETYYNLQLGMLPFCA